MALYVFHNLTNCSSYLFLARQCRKRVAPGSIDLRHLSGSNSFVSVSVDCLLRPWDSMGRAEANLDSVKVATQGKTREEKLEAGSASMNKAESNKPRMIMCGTCQLERPVTAKHCYECGVCVDNLTTTAPWTGKCT